jgi:hypothetical protein
MPKIQGSIQQFPIFSYEDYDFEFKKRGYPIGLKSTYPEELIQRVSAARLSYLMHLSSVDYTRKQYLKDKKYEMNDGSRLDLRVSAALKKRTELLSELLARLSERPEKSHGEIVGEWTLLRVPFATKILLSCANRGALFESVSIARMLLEQVAWAIKINTLDDIEKIQSTSATKAVLHLKTICPSAGRLYGWLSSHAHWMYEGHVKAMDFDDGRMVALFATSKFKRQALALSVVLTAIIIYSFGIAKESIIGTFFKKAMEDSPFAFEIDDDRFGRPKITELKSIQNQNELFNLMNELVYCDDRDEDVEALSGMMPQVQTLETIER